MFQFLLFWIWGFLPLKFTFYQFLRFASIQRDKDQNYIINEGEN